jgi:chemotaxis protein methyltransferase CheR
MTDEDYLFLARLARRRGGLDLPEGRGAKLEWRLKPVLQRFGLGDVSALIAQLKLGHETLAEAVVEAFTVSETSFFRDKPVFERLGNEILPGLMAAPRREKRLGIWSAACATGQEVWSLAMLLDGLPLKDWSVDLIGSDLSRAAVARAELGHYSQFEVLRGLSEEDVARYFRAQERGFLVSETLRRRARFRVFNLLDSFGWLDSLDLILCRNVLMHFDRAQRTDVLERLAETLAPGGVLVLGEAETALPPAAPYREMPGLPGFFTRAGAQVMRFSAAS